MQRKRKTKEPCPGCGLHLDLCLCSLIPTLELKTKVCLVVHAKELKRTSNTGRLAIKSLQNSELRIRGAERTALDLSDWVQDSRYETFLFYPSEDALTLTTEMIQNLSKPVQLIVPDGNWRQAGKVHTRHPELANVQRVMISAPNPSAYHLRKEHTEEGMATLQAIACALEVIEGEETGRALMGLYEEKLKRTLKARGIKTTL